MVSENFPRGESAGNQRKCDHDHTLSNTYLLSWMKEVFFLVGNNVPFHTLS
jgi:hypothetical protein